jgi:hypothetical protein
MMRNRKEKEKEKKTRKISKKNSIFCIGDVFFTTGK